MTEKELTEKADKIYFQKSSSRYPKAIAAYKELLKAFPKNTHGWAMISTMQSSAKLFDDALFSIDQAIDLDENNSRYLNQKATLLHMINKLDFKNDTYQDRRSKKKYKINTFKSVAELKRAIISNCDNQLRAVADDYYNLGTILETKANTLQFLGEYKPAIAAFEKALEFHKIHSRDGFINFVSHSLLSIGKLYEECEEDDEAVKYYDLAFKEEPNKVFRKHKAKALEKKGSLNG